MSRSLGVERAPRESRRAVAPSWVVTPIILAPVLLIMAWPPATDTSVAVKVPVTVTPVDDVLSFSTLS